MKKPTPEEQERSLRIRKCGKRGEYISSEDSRFNMRIYNKFPEWYKASENIVFNDTVPFGSEVRRSINPELYK